MAKNIKEEFNDIISFKSENPEQKRSGCIYYQDASNEILEKYEIEDEVFKHCIFSKANLNQCKFINCTFLQCSFTEAILKKCVFINCIINNCNFSFAMLISTQFVDCKKTNNNLNHLQCMGNTKGLSAKDDNVMQDEIVNQDEETQTEKDYKRVFIEKIKKIMSDEFPKWEIEQESEDKYPSFVYSDQDKFIGLSLYSDEEKNTTDTDNFWCLSVFLKDDVIFTSDFNLFGLESADIISLIKNWIETVLKNNASTILPRIFENLK